MTQNWRKLGLIHRPDTSKAWAVNGYCHVPTPLVMGDTVRVYYASLDANNRGSIGFVDLDGDDLTKVKYVSPEPVLTPGPSGAFDCDGVVPSCVYNGLDGYGAPQTFIWYIGFQRCETVPYMLFSGRAILGNEWRRESVTPRLDRIPSMPYSRSAPFVLQADDQMPMLYYWSCDYWGGDPVRYHNSIYVDYLANTYKCISFVTPDYAVGRPWVVKEDGVYKMWYSIRSTVEPTYRMGYAESQGGLAWQRKDGEVKKLNQVPFAEGRTIEAEYPAIVDSGGKRWMLYNGRQHGKDGILLAVLE